MPVDAAAVAEVRRLMAMPDNDTTMQAFDSHAALLGFVASEARTDGRDEADAVELVVRSASAKPDELREAEGLLRRLGYVAVADRLKWLAGRRKRDLRPLS
jgi:hypothetical protein